MFDEIITLDTGAEITVGTAMADIHRAASFLVSDELGSFEDRQTLASDLNTANHLLKLLAFQTSVATL